MTPLIKAKLILAYVLGYVQWYLLSMVLLCLRFWLSLVGVLVTDEFMKLFRNPKSPIVIEEAYSNNAKITRSLDTLVSWILEQDENGTYINVEQIMRVLGKIPQFIRTRNEHMVISRTGKRVSYRDAHAQQKSEQDILFNCLYLTRK